MRKIPLIQEAVKVVAKRYKNRMNSSLMKDWYGWEKWFQVELAHHLQDGGDTNVEMQYYYNQNKKLPINKANNSSAFIDIIYRKSNDLKPFNSAIEITLDRTEQGLRKVRADLMKVRAIKNSEWDFRSVIAIFIFKKGGSKTDSKYSRIMNEILNNKEFQGEIFTCGEFDFFTFGWEPKISQTKFMKNSEYNSWLKKLNEIYANEGIKLKVATKKKAASKSAAH